MRAVFASLERAAPSAGARLAHRIWFALPARAPGGSVVPHRIGRSPGAPFEVSLQGRVVRGWSRGGGPVVYLVHGWAGSAEQLAPLAQPLLDHGFTVVSFDGLSHGRSDPGEHGPHSSDAIELGRVLGAVAARFGPARAVVAHSMGALAALLAIREGWVSSERLVLLAPFSGIPDYLSVFRSKLGFGERTERRLALLARARTGYDIADLDAPRLGAEIGHPPVLIVHDEADREMPYFASARLSRAWPGSVLATTHGLGHNRLLAAPDVGDLVARFVARRAIDPTPLGVQSAPLGADPAAHVGAGR